MKKHAFLIGAYKNPDYLLDLIDSLDSPKSSFYIHVNLSNDSMFTDFKEKIRDRENIRYYSTIKIKYAGSGLLRSQMFLCNEALKDEDNAYFHFITGQDILCCPLEVFFSHIENKPVNFIKYQPMSKEWDYRYKYYFLYDLTGGYSYKSLQRVNGLLIRIQKLCHFERKRFPFSRIFYGSGWWSIRRDACNYIVSRWNKDNVLRKRVKYTYAPDEMLVPTILLNADVEFPIINDNLRYMKWGGGVSPETLMINDYEDILKSGKYFARKIDPVVSSGLINKIILYLHGNV